MKRTFVASLACAAVLSGCANGFAQYYHGMTREQVVAGVGTRPEVDPKVIVTGNVRGESEYLAENGYALVGESSFQGPRSRFAESKAVSQAKSIGADTVVLAEGDAGSDTVAMPMVTPNSSTSYSSFSGSAFNPAYGTTHVNGIGTTTSYGTTTTYVPMTIHRADYYAGFWVKGKPPIFGAHVSPLTAEQHKQIGTNSGVMVRVVVIGSPAYRADIFKGDYLMAIAGEPVQSFEDFQRIARAHAGELVQVSIIRDGSRLEKSIQLASPGS